MEKRGNNGFIAFLLIIIILLMIGFGSIFSGLVKVNGPFIYIGNDPAKSSKAADDDKPNTEIVDPNAIPDVAPPDATPEETKPAEETIPKSSAIEIKPQKATVPTSQILSYYEERLKNYPNCQYSVMDINNDKIPELFIYTSGNMKNQIIAYTDVYTYDEDASEAYENHIVYAGQVQGRIDNNTVLYKMNSGNLLSVYGHMGEESTTTFYLANAWLVRTDYTSRKVAKDDEYTKGDVVIEFKKTSDKSLIKNYKEV